MKISKLSEHTKTDPYAQTKYANNVGFKLINPSAKSDLPFFSRDRVNVKMARYISPFLS